MYHFISSGTFVCYCVCTCFHVTCQPLLETKKHLIIHYVLSRVNCQFSNRVRTKHKLKGTLIE